MSKYTKKIVATVSLKRRNYGHEELSACIERIGNLNYSLCDIDVADFRALLDSMWENGFA